MVCENSWNREANCYTWNHLFASIGSQFIFTILEILIAREGETKREKERKREREIQRETKKG